jgi:hypothetical protein
MKRKPSTALHGWVLLVLGLCLSVHAQVYSQNIVGYYNLPLSPGGNLIANQFDNGDDTLNSLFTNGTPAGASFSKWDAALVEYLPLSTYNPGSGWSINYDLGFGEGGLFNAPVTFTNTFVGSIWPGFSANGPFEPPLVSGTGVFLLSSMIPIGGATFFDVVGRDPLNGDNVTTLDPLTQQTTTTTCLNGAWNNGDPSLAVGQSAFFGLGAGNDTSGITVVPEPVTGSLLGAGLLAQAACRRGRGKS